jgi:hypothetical protein
LQGSAKETPLVDLGAADLFCIVSVNSNTSMYASEKTNFSGEQIGNMADTLILSGPKGFKGELKRIIFRARQVYKNKDETEVD